MLKKLITIALAALFLTPGCNIAQSQTLTWKFQSFDNKALDIQFYADDHKHMRPDHRAAYSIEDRSMHNYTLSCAAGEKICYGAWVRGNASAFWGKGSNDKQRCSDCCYACNGGTTPTHKLNAHSTPLDESHVFHFY